MTATMICFDGTGPVNDNIYYDEMIKGYDNTNKRCTLNKSFVSRVYDYWGDPATSKYIFGPGGALEMRRSVSTGLADAKEFFKSKDSFKDGPIFAVGYSRGGLTAIQYANWLAEQKVEVEALFLFDAVARDVTTTTSDLDSSLIKYIKAPKKTLTSGLISIVQLHAMFFKAGFLAADYVNAAFYNPPIPSNVKNAYHAMRDPAVQSRWYFDNCGKTGSKNLQSKTFYCTHAGMGGLPWSGDHPVRMKKVAPIGNTGMSVTTSATLWGAPSYQLVQDPGAFEPTITESVDFANSAAVWAWMNARLALHMHRDLLA